jgi:hypothetical protein
MGEKYGFNLFRGGHYLDSHKNRRYNWFDPLDTERSSSPAAKDKDKND